MTRGQFLAFVAPSALVMAALLILPLGVTGYLSLQQLSLGGTPVFAGLANFVSLLDDREFWTALGFTLLYVAIALPIHTFAGFVLALMLERVKSRMRAVLLSAYSMPFILTPVVGTLIFSWLFKDYWGLIPYLLGKIGVHVAWFSQVTPARAVLIAWGVWWTFGFNVMVLFAGLQTLPEEQLRAAIIDGASYLQRVRSIVIPHLMPFFALITLFNLVDGLRVFDSIWVITKGGPGTSTETLAYMTYRAAFTLKDLGRGSALAVLSVAVTAILLVPILYFRFRDELRVQRAAR